MLLFCIAVFSIPTPLKYSIASIANNPRILIIIGKEKLIQKQLDKLIPYHGELKERDLVILRQNANNTLTIDPDFKIDKPLSTISLNKYHPYLTEVENPEFGLYLIGKDGKMKQSWIQLVEFQIIADIIDAMPMRKREMSKAK